MAWRCACASDVKHLAAHMAQQSLQQDGDGDRRRKHCQGADGLVRQDAVVDLQQRDGKSQGQ
jgi:hypothetical protein